MRTMQSKYSSVLYLIPILTVAAVLPYLANAQSITEGGAGRFGDFVSGATDLINNFLIPFLIALAVLGFIYGVFQFFILGSSDEEKRAQGRSLMLYALLGFVAIVALWGIVNFLVEAFGFDETAGPGKTVGPSTGG